MLSDRHAKIAGPWHSHRRRQLLHVSAGVLTVETRAARYVIPPQRAVWIPPGVEHRILSAAPFWLTTCYVDAALMPTLPGETFAVSVDRLCDALLIAASGFGADAPRSGKEERLVAVLLDCLAALPVFDVVLPLPESARLRRVTDRLMARPERSDTLAELAAGAALTERTAARLFKAETGMAFGAWRLTLRVQLATGLLAGGMSVTQTAFAVGYRDVSSFIEAFRSVFGHTPSQMMKRQEGAREAG